MKKTPSTPESSWKVLGQLFVSTLYLSAFTFGGGYVIVSLLKLKFVDELNWLDEDEMLDLVAIAQSSPGSIAVNGAIVLGYKLAGLWGVLVSVVATVIPPFTIIVLISFFYDAFRQNHWIALMLEGMEAGVAAVIASVVITMTQGLWQETQSWIRWILPLAFVANYFFQVNVMVVILVCIGLGLLQVLWQSFKTKEDK